MKTLVLGLMPGGATPEDCIAAGPWCFCGQEAAFPDWERRFTFAPEPLAQASALPAACRAAQTLCARLIPETAALLVPEPGNWPDTYWQILLAPWLMDLASQLVDRALRSNAMIAAYGADELTVPLLPDACEFCFGDEHDFTLAGSLGTEFNHWLFSLLLRQKWPEKWQAVELDPVRSKKKAESLFARLGNPARKIIKELAFPRLKGMSLLQAARYGRCLDHPCKTPDHSLNLADTFNFADDLAAIRLPSDLAPILKKCLPASIRALKHKQIARSKNAPRLKIAGIASHDDAQLRQKLAIWRANGNRLAHIQHGANYGQVKTPCSAEVIEYSQDAFFTWGWRSQGKAEGNFVPVPMPQLSVIANSWRMGDKLIFIGTEMPAYGRRLDSHPTPLQYVRYRQAKADFFRALGSELQRKSLYRPYFDLPGTLADADWLLPQFPGLGLCKDDLLPQMQTCRLLVIDHHGTSLLEAMAANIPVVLYWQREYWPVCPEFDILLELLAQAGIWQPDAALAARKAREIWTDPQGWQQSEAVQLVRRVFCVNQARHEKDYSRVWLKTLSCI